MHEKDFVLSGLSGCTAAMIPEETFATCSASNTGFTSDYRIALEIAVTDEDLGSATCYADCLADFSGSSCQSCLPDLEANALMLVQVFCQETADVAILEDPAFNFNAALENIIGCIHPMVPEVTVDNCLTSASVSSTCKTCTTLMTSEASNCFSSCDTDFNSVACVGCRDNWSYHWQFECTSVPSNSCAGTPQIANYEPLLDYYRCLADFPGIGGNMTTFDACVSLKSNLLNAMADIPASPGCVGSHQKLIQAMQDNCSGVSISDCVNAIGSDLTAFETSAGYSLTTSDIDCTNFQATLSSDASLAWLGSAIWLANIATDKSGSAMARADWVNSLGSTFGASSACVSAFLEDVVIGGLVSAGGVCYKINRFSSACSAALAGAIELFEACSGTNLQLTTIPEETCSTSQLHTLSVSNVTGNVIDHAIGPSAGSIADWFSRPIADGRIYDCANCAWYTVEYLKAKVEALSAAAVESDLLGCANGIVADCPGYMANVMDGLSQCSGGIAFTLKPVVPSAIYSTLSVEPFYIASTSGVVRILLNDQYQLPFQPSDYFGCADGVSGSASCIFTLVTKASTTNVVIGTPSR